jgi:uncharacterized protein YyaL (SSP411 family)
MALVTIALLIVACGASDGAEEPSTSTAEGREHVADDHGHGGDHDGREPNRLIHEKSPYLLQHAYNPVDWHPWGDEAFELAKKLDKPIFLSIGYSTCHWCHVMERESFEVDSIATLMNEHFVCIKVDREERPDVDQLYMAAVQGMTGSGGWPMSVFITPDGNPFWGGTYFPPEDRQGRPGFVRILTQLSDAWTTNRAEVESSAERIAAALNQMPSDMLTSQTPDAIGVSLLDDAYRQLSSRFEPTYGGFSGAPKFPTPHTILFLLRHAHRTGDAKALEMARKTLDNMAIGGIHDHLGGGFHRYSTDNVWLAPHFEKMLYDQAGLAKAYTEAWLVTGAPEYRHVAEGILDYVIRDMTHEGGGFYAAEDADSEGHEGTFYVWTPSEVDARLGDDGPSFRETYDVAEGGNFEGKSILHTDSFEPMLDGSLDAARRKLFDVRATRIRPHLDDKIITAWNGYMIEAFCLAGRAFGEPRYIEAGARAAEFVWNELRNDDTLLRHYRGGAADIDGYIDDYAFYGRALVTLFETTRDVVWLQRANETAASMENKFRHETGVFRFTADDGGLIAPVVEAYDGAMPSGNSAAAVFLLRLGHLTGDGAREQRGYEVLTGLSGTVSNGPSNHLELMNALTFSVGPVTEIVLAGDPDDPVMAAFRAEVAKRYRPNTVVVERAATGADELESLVSYVEAQGAIGGKPTAYVCRGYACRLPVHDAAAFAAELDKP